MQRIDRVAGDQRQCVAGKAPGQILAKATQRQRRIGESAAHGQQRGGRAGEPAEQHHGRVPQPPGAADHQNQAEQVLDDHHPGIGGIEIAGAGDGAMIIEQPGGDAGQHGGGDQHRRQAKIDPRGHRRDKQRAERQADAGSQQIQRRPDFGLRLPRSLRIEAHGRELQPIHQRGVDQHDDRGADGVAAELVRPEKQRDQQAEHEIHAGIDHEGQQDCHCGWGMPPLGASNSWRAGL